MNVNVKIKEKKKGLLFKSKLDQVEGAYNNNEANKFCQEVNSLIKEFKPPTLLIRGKESNIRSKQQRESLTKVV
jgi:hypothetical protein